MPIDSLYTRSCSSSFDANVGILDPAKTRKSPLQLFSFFGIFYYSVMFIVLGSNQVYPFVAYLTNLVSH